MDLAFHNTLTGRKDPFVPLNPPRVTLYTCGPTVWWYAHIGNFRTAINMDVLRRTMEVAGLQVEQVVNITDVDDRIIDEARKGKKTLREFTEPYETAFFEDLETLGVERAEHYPRATEHIADMIELIRCLIEKGAAYERDGSVYFRVSSFERYGQLAHLDMSGLKAGARVDSDRYDKETVNDFALWKVDPDFSEAWDSPWGRGRPGWHLECSAMSRRYLGDTLDIHAGAVDLIFPHHTNEIAQSESCTGKPFVRLWVHAEHLMVDGASMSKTTGNVYTVRDLLERGYTGPNIRFALLGAHYRSRLNFTFDVLASARQSLDRLVELVERLKAAAGSSQEDGPELLAREAEVEAQWKDALADDLNLPQALGKLFDWVREANAALDRGELGPREARSGLALVRSVDRVLNCIGPARAARSGDELSAEEQAPLEQRAQARAGGDWKESDRLRQQLLELGLVVEDTKSGQRWKRVGPQRPAAEGGK